MPNHAACVSTLAARMSVVVICRTAMQKDNFLPQMLFGMHRAGHEKLHCKARLDLHRIHLHQQPNYVSKPPNLKRDVKHTWISIAYTSTSCVPLLGSSLPSSFWHDLRAETHRHTLCPCGYLRSRSLLRLSLPSSFWHDLRAATQRHTLCPGGYPKIRALVGVVAAVLTLARPARRHNPNYCLQPGTQHQSALHTSR